MSAAVDSGPASGDRFAGRRVLVTGGTEGMGAAIAALFSARGASVIVTARSAPLPMPGGVAFIGADLRERSAIDALVDAIDTSVGGIDILINCVGGSSSGGGGALRQSDDIWDDALQTNLMAAVRLDRALLPGMVERRHGVIIHIGSIQRRMPLYESTLAYAAAKAALINYSKGLANEFGGRGVRVNAVSPGTVATAFVDRLLQNFADPVAERAAMDARQAIGRMVLPHEVANAIAYLASPLSAATTGTALDVDGGVTHLRVRPA